MNRRSLEGRAAGGKRPAVVVAVFVVILVVSSCARSADENVNACGARVVDVNIDLPDFEGETIYDEPFDMSEYRSGIVVLNVWGAWCVPCRAEALDLAASARELAGRGVRFLGIDIRDNKPAARSYDKEFDVPYPSIFDRPGKVAADLNVPAPPATLFVKDGAVRSWTLGAVDSDLIRCAVDELVDAA